MAENKYKFERLTPTDNVDLEVYEEAIDYVFDNPDVRNIAISGAYSAGKSSILASYKKKHKDDSPVSTIERYTKKKGFVNATAELTLISLVKTKETYSIMPTFNDFEKGPLCIDDDERLLANPYNEGELFEQIHDIIMVYMKANAFYKEMAEAERRKDNQ